LTQLEQLKINKNAELDIEIETVKNLFFGKTPSSLMKKGYPNNTRDLKQEWLSTHKNNGWELVSSTPGTKNTNVTYQNKATQEIHSLDHFWFQYDLAYYLHIGLIDLGTGIEKLSKNIINRKTLNNYFLCDTFKFNEALLLLLGFNPATGLDLALSDDKFNSILIEIICSYDTKEYRLLNKGWARLKDNEIGFIDWAIEKKLLIKYQENLKKTSHNKITKKENNIEKLRHILLSHLHTIKKPKTVNWHAHQGAILELLSQENINIEPDTLNRYLAQIVTSGWWRKQDQKTIQNKVIYTPKKII
jgi:hypothetical protein